MKVKKKINNKKKNKKKTYETKRTHTRTGRTSVDSQVRLGTH